MHSRSIGSRDILRCWAAECNAFLAHFEEHFSTERPGQDICPLEVCVRFGIHSPVYQWGCHYINFSSNAVCRQSFDGRAHNHRSAPLGMRDQASFRKGLNFAIGFSVNEVLRVAVQVVLCSLLCFTFCGPIDKYPRPESLRARRSSRDMHLISYGVDDRYCMRTGDKRSRQRSSCKIG